MTLPAAPSQAPSLPRSVGLKPNSGFIATFRALWPYLWPTERADLKGRVVGAFALMLAGRLVLMGVPFTFKWITDALADGNRVELRGFGAFSVKNRPARTGRNPRTGESVEVEEKWVPFFKTGKELRERLNGAK